MSREEFIKTIEKEIESVEETINKYSMISSEFLEAECEGFAQIFKDMAKEEESHHRYLNYILSELKDDDLFGDIDDKSDTAEKVDISHDTKSTLMNLKNNY